MSPGASDGGAPKSLEKVLEKSEKSGKSLEMSVQDFGETFSGLFGTLDFFSDFLFISGPESPKDCCSSPKGFATFQEPKKKQPKD